MQTKNGSGNASTSYDGLYKEPRMSHHPLEPAVDVLERNGSFSEEYVDPLGADHHDPAIAAWEDEGGAIHPR